MPEQNKTEKPRKKDNGQKDNGQKNKPTLNVLNRFAMDADEEDMIEPASCCGGDNTRPGPCCGG